MPEVALFTVANTAPVAGDYQAAAADLTGRRVRAWPLSIYMLPGETVLALLRTLAR